MPFFQRNIARQYMCSPQRGLKLRVFFFFFLRNKLRVFESAKLSDHSSSAQIMVQDYKGMYRNRASLPHYHRSHIQSNTKKQGQNYAEQRAKIESQNSRHGILRSDINNIALNYKTRKSITSRNYFKNCWHLSRCESKNFIAKRQLKQTWSLETFNNRKWSYQQQYIRPHKRKVGKGNVRMMMHFCNKMKDSYNN